MMEFDQYNQEHIRKLEKIQSHCRSNHVKNEMKKLRKTYEKIFHDIEGDVSDVRIEWNAGKSNLASYPKFVSKKQPLLTGSTNAIKNNSSQKETDKQSALSFNKELITTTTTTTTTTTIATTSNVSKKLDIENMDYLELDNLKKLTKTELINLRENISLEMLWIQQAIQSRMQYLKLKKNFQTQKSLN